MNDTVDRVAMAIAEEIIFEFLGDHHKRVWRDTARAAIEAMRKPGVSAIKAGTEYRLKTTIGGENRWPDDTAALWETMIDAILNENDV